MSKRKTQSERRRLNGLTVNLFADNTMLGWRVLRQVAAEFALEQIALKKWREIWFEDGTLAGVQPLKPVERSALSEALIEPQIAVTITNSELRRNAGLYGKSRTIGMPEWKRLQRHARFDEKKILAPEDATERAIEKVRQWPFPQSVVRNADGSVRLNKNGDPVFGDKAVRVYPVAPLALNKVKRGK